ncbi:hypothetical protein [Aquimarina sp. AD10]|uniref:hypothetical protein n=1 Tax=Aquimarina sp. AD10 TaxID=1714849 RepID=UPI0011C44B35|nr:hypothetical protein [Aquimarina sp. AD10]
MILYRLLLFLFISCMLSCKEQEIKKNQISINNQILSLTTQKTKEQFLEGLFDSDQAARNSGVELEILKRNNYDQKSEEYQDYIRKMIETDSINFLKSKKYLEVYGHPNTKDFSSKASYAVKTICLHQTYKKQLELFPYMYEGYTKGYLTNESFSFLLNRLHINKYGTSYPQAINDEENIKQLLEKLKLN